MQIYVNVRWCVLFFLFYYLTFPRKLMQEWKVLIETVIMFVKNIYECVYFVILFATHENKAHMLRLTL